MDAATLLIIIACSATAHLITACVVGIFARYKIQYLALMWLDAIFAFALLFLTFYSRDIAEAHPVIMHPLMLLTLTAITFLQSIYPLSIPMPGFLQWGRMFRYAQPAIILIVLYFALSLVFGWGVTIDSLDALAAHLYSWDVILRIASVLISAYYILNIFHLPRVMARSADVPAFLIGYCTALGVVMVYYLVVSVFYNATLIGIYLVLLTLLNLYLAFRTLEEMAIRLPKPLVGDALEEASPELEVVPDQKREDFNEANLHRFHHIQYWMQHNKEKWIDNAFGRDRLCEEVGYNRHLVLQSLRSQGFSNVHEFIVSYRVAELKRLIKRGAVASVADASLVGFGTLITARSCFKRVEGVSLDDYLQRAAPKC